MLRQRKTILKVLSASSIGSDKNDKLLSSKSRMNLVQTFKKNSFKRIMLSISNERQKCNGRISNFHQKQLNFSILTMHHFQKVKREYKDVIQRRDICLHIHTYMASAIHFIKNATSFLNLSRTFKKRSHKRCRCIISAKKYFMIYQRFFSIATVPRISIISQEEKDDAASAQSRTQRDVLVQLLLPFNGISFFVYNLE